MIKQKDILEWDRACSNSEKQSLSFNLVVCAVRHSLQPWTSSKSLI